MAVSWAGADAPVSAGENCLEDRNILSDWNCDLQRMPGAFARVILGEALAQPVGLHTNNGIRVLIERRRATASLERDRIFLDAFGFSGELPLAEIGEEMSERWRASE